LIFATILALILFVLICLVLKSKEMVSLLGSIKRKMLKSVTILDVSETEEL